MGKRSFNLEIRVRNAPLLRAIRQQYGTIANMVKANPEISQPRVSSLVTMRESPYRQDGNITPIAMLICDALDAVPQDLWPAEVLQRGTSKSRSEFEVSGEELHQIAAQAQSPQLASEQRATIVKLLASVSGRERAIISKRYITGSATYEDIAQEQGVTRERIRQIELRGFRKMREHARKIGVRSLEDVL